VKLWESGLYQQGTDLKLSLWTAHHAPARKKKNYTDRNGNS